ncbi:ATP-grasp domain-containing protein [Streptomyces camelliae]|uniref:ATP-grasp domain-containing protein n=1 Tax=Streptomyces camelliae TaxID=3004093 RepID=A0ABY7PIQ2_9ACTN|nr:hypothetical protein [Streptomyces sp. HUAS 2-6]WBO69649.1 hypothetical protein O1G22_43700 [Streptomyces sp. HUAS 2-6]
MTEVVLLRSGNPRRLTEPAWRGTVELCAKAGVQILSTPPDPPGGPEDALGPSLFTPVPENATASELAALLAEHGPEHIVHCADPDALVRRDAEAARRYGHARGRADDAERTAAAFATLLHKGRTRDLCERLAIDVADGVWGPASDALLRRRASELLGRYGRVLVKDPEGWASRGQSQTATPHELDAALDAYGEHPVVVEAFVAGEEISVEVLTHHGQHLVLGWAVKGGTEEGGHPLHRLRLAPAGPVPAALADRAVRLCAAAGHEGIAEVEFVVGADGRACVLECNPRVSAISRVFAVGNGFSSTELAVRAALGGLASLPEVARAEAVDRALPADLPPEALASLVTAPGVAWVHPVTDGFQPRVLLGGVAGGGRTDEAVRQVAALTGIDLTESLEQRRATARALLSDHRIADLARR